MRGLLARVTGAPIRWQIATLLIVAQLAAHVAATTLVNGVLESSGTRPDALAVESVGPLVTVLQIATALGGDRGAEVVIAAVQSDRRFRISTRPPSSVVNDRTAIDERFQDAVRASVPDAWKSRVIAYEVSSARFRWLPGRSPGAAARFANGNWLIFEQGQETIWRLFPFALALLGILILAIPLAFLALWSTSVLVSPISGLAAAADRFSRDLNAPEIEVRGAREIRVAATAFNAMREKIRRLVEDRSRTLAAISHDMRTPLTRLKLRVEGIDDPELRDPIMSDINIIQRMINSALSFLRSQRKPLSLVQADLAVLVQTVVAYLSDQGMKALYQGPDRLVIACDRDLIRRALENLTNNAIMHAGSVVARLNPPVGDWVVIDILDEGPGIPQRDRELVTEPFRKVDGSRPVAESSFGAGFGLGLAITRTIVEAHGGTLTLRSNRPRGLVASIRLPIHPSHIIDTNSGGARLRSRSRRADSIGSAA